LPLNLYCWGAYAAYDHVATPYRDDDYVVNGMVRAVKGTLPARQFAYVRALDGNRYRIAAGTEPLAFAVFGQWGASLLAQWKSALIIPVPSSSHTTFGIPFTGSKLAESIAARMPTEANVHAAPILAFKSKMPRASAGESGGRDKTAIQAALQVTSLSSLKGQSVVLVDDVHDRRASRRVRKFPARSRRQRRLRSVPCTNCELPASDSAASPAGESRIVFGLSL
jgi:hypothetical protein